MGLINRRDFSQRRVQNKQTTFYQSWLQVDWIIFAARYNYRWLSVTKFDIEIVCFRNDSVYAVYSWRNNVSCLRVRMWVFFFPFKIFFFFFSILTFRYRAIKAKQLDDWRKRSKYKFSKEISICIHTFVRVYNFARSSSIVCNVVIAIIETRTTGGMCMVFHIITKHPFPSSQSSLLKSY